MSERDLIEELQAISEDRHGAKNTHLLSWLEKGYFHCQHGSEEWCQGDYLDSARAYIERLEAVSKASLATIARLSEALAEAEKKGDEDWRDMASAPRDASEIIVRIPNKSWPGYYRQIAHWAEGGGDDQPPFRGWFRFMADGYVELPVKPTGWMPLPAPPRDLSQGGQP